MRRFFLVLAVLVFALSGSLEAQLTDESSVDFKIRVVKTTPIFGDPVVTVRPWFDPDTIGTEDLTLTAKVDSVIDSMHVTLTYAVRYKQWRGTRTIRVYTHAELWLPDSSLNTQIPDSLFSIVLDDTRPLVAGESFRITVREPEALIDRYGYQKITVKNSALFEDWR